MNINVIASIIIFCKVISSFEKVEITNKNETNRVQLTETMMSWPYTIVCLY